MAIAEKDLQQGDLQQEAGPVSAPAPAAPVAPAAGKRGKKQPAAAGAVPAAAPAPAAPAARKKIKVPAFVPWLLLPVPLLVGGFWLVLHPEVITDNLNKPYALLAGPALVGSLLAGWLVVKFFAGIAHAVRSAWGAFFRAYSRDSSAQFFWLVIAVFLAVSVFASGDFFSLLERNALPGLGYATALFIDLVAVQCMRARLNAGRLRDRAGQFLYLLGVLICASASAFANVYTTLSTFNDKGGGLLPPWMSTVAPWFGLVFPGLIVLLSMTADYTVDQTSSKLNPDQYKEQEGKRVKLLSIQRDLLRDRVGIEQEIDDLAAQLRGRKERRVFFLVAWLFPLQMGGKQLLARVEALYRPQVEALTAQNETLRGQLAGLATDAQAAYAGLNQFVQGFVQSQDAQRDIDNRLLVERIEALAAVPAAAAAPDYQALAAAVLPLLRQELRSMLPARAAAPELNYNKLARALAPLVVAKQDGLIEVNTAVSEPANGAVNGASLPDTEELRVLDIDALTSLNGHSEDDINEDENEGQEADLDALWSQTTVSINQAARLIGCEVKYARTLRDRGNLKATPRNKEKITTASIKSYLAETKRPIKA